MSFKNVSRLFWLVIFVCMLTFIWYPLTTFAINRMFINKFIITIFTHDIYKLLQFIILKKKCSSQIILLITSCQYYMRFYARQCDADFYKTAKTTWDIYSYICYNFTLIESFLMLFTCSWALPKTRAIHRCDYILGDKILGESGAF